MNYYKEFYKNAVELAIESAVLFLLLVLLLASFVYAAIIQNDFAPALCFAALTIYAIIAGVKCTADSIKDAKEYKSMMSK